MGQTSFVARQFSCSFNIAIICSSEKRDIFIIVSIAVEDSTTKWRKFTGAGQSVMAGPACTHFVLEIWNLTTKDYFAPATYHPNSFKAVADYGYDIHQLRISKTLADGTIIHYHYDDQGRMISETNGGTGEIIREYIWFGLSPVALTGEDGLHFIHTDHLGKPTFVTDTFGTSVWDGGITTPFGVSLNTVGAFTQSPQHLLKSIHWIDFLTRRVSALRFRSRVPGSIPRRRDWL